jgi:hypothetical protein
MHQSQNADELTNWDGTKKTGMGHLIISSNANRRA